ncbi:TonB-dependent receptor [Fulvitalea axinellae]
MIKHITLTLFFCFTFLYSFSQTTISGTVKDKAGEPLFGANIFLEGTYDGAGTDNEGRFEFSTGEKGKHILVIRFVGFKEKKVQISIDEKPITKDVILKPDASSLDAVVISAGSMSADDSKRNTILKPLDIVTTAGATGDLYGAIQTLPGTQKVEEDGRLFVRGGDAYETKTFVDGLWVPKPYNSRTPDMPSRGRFSAMMFRGTHFNSGGYSAEYGEALSSTLLLETYDLPERSETGLSFMTHGIGASHKHSGDNYGIIGELNYFNLAPYMNVIPQDVEFDKMPENFQGQLIYRAKTSKTGILKTYFSYQTSKAGVYYNDLDRSEKYKVGLRNNNLYLNANWKEAIGKKWMVYAGLVSAWNTDLLDVENRLEEEKKEFAFQAKLKFEGDLAEGLTLKTGLEHFRNPYRYKYGLPSGYSGDFESKRSFSVLFSETEWWVDNRLAFRAGLRSTLTHSDNKAQFSPRFSAAYKLNAEGQLSLAWGKFRQSPRPIDRIYNSELKTEYAEHYILSYLYSRNKRNLKIEAYAKRYDGLVTFENEKQPDTYSNGGDGYAAGLDVFWHDRQSIKNLEYWISYGYVDTERFYRGFPKKAKPKFASDHNLSVVTKYFVRSIDTQFGLTYSFSSGRPYNHPADDTFNGREAQANHDISLSASYLTEIKGNFTILFVSLRNALALDKVYGYRFSQVPNIHNEYSKEAIVPPARIGVFVGLFVNIAHNKKEAE